MRRLVNRDAKMATVLFLLPSTHTQYLKAQGACGVFADLPWVPAECLCSPVQQPDEAERGAEHWLHQTWHCEWEHTDLSLLPLPPSHLTARGLTTHKALRQDDFCMEKQWKMSSGGVDRATVLHLSTSRENWSQGLTSQILVKLTLCLKRIF